MDNLSLKDQLALDSAKSGGWRARSKEEMALIRAAQPKCVNHPKSFATKGSREKGTLLCRYCDPDYQKRDEIKRNAKKRSGRRRLMIPASIAEFYETATLDEHLIELREDIAVTEARIQQILKQIKDNPYESSAFITFFQKTFSKQLSLVKRGMLSYPEFISSMQAILNGKVSEIQQYQEFYKVTEQKRKLVETETKRVKDLGWTPDYVYAVVMAMTKALKQVVPLTKTLEFQQLLAQDQVFQNKAFNILPSVDLIKTTENEVKQEKYVDTTNNNGTYIPVQAEVRVTTENESTEDGGPCGEWGSGGEVAGQAGA